MFSNPTSTPKMLKSTEMLKSTLSTPEEFDCITIEESKEIIVIDDDDDNETDKENNLKNVTEEISQINKIFNNTSSESSKSTGDELILNNSTIFFHSSNDENTSVEENQKNINNDEQNQNNINMSIVNNEIKNNIVKIIENNKEENKHMVGNELSDQTKLYETRTSEESFSISSLTCDAKNTGNNDTVICLDDTTIKEIPTISTKNSSLSVISDDSDIDDSIIFVSESIDVDKFQPTTSKALDYIPLDYKSSSPPCSPKAQKSNAIDVKKLKTPYVSLIKRKRSDIFTAKEYKKICNYNTNTYNPNKESNEEPKKGKRMVLIDGSNVAFHHALSKTFSVRGLEICLEYFEKMGHDVKAVVPQFRLQKGKSTDPKKLETLYHENKIVFTPCKNIPGHYATSYDDRFILQLATELDAAVVSNDNYRDLINENPAFKKVIVNRVIGYTWCNDMFILPKDPYGRLGPNLSTILNRT